MLTSYQPDRVLGVFRFTLKVSAAAAGIPYDSLACGCMMPDAGEVLGYAPEDGQMHQQAQYLKDLSKDLTIPGVCRPGRPCRWTWRATLPSATASRRHSPATCFSSLSAISGTVASCETTDEKYWKPPRQQHTARAQDSDLAHEISAKVVDIPGQLDVV